jgi:Salmonella virulence plasmid 65kDa B protein
VGYTVGNFAVGQSGGASYSVPITVPHGIADLQPTLSLDYSSQAGPGLAGLGWNLSGIASITRCPRTKRQDGINGAVTFTATDRFCLNGQRLVLDGSTFAYGSIGATYRTEGESFARVTALTNTVTGAMYFKMQTKSGLVYEFGNTVDSAVKPGPSVVGAALPTVPLMWAVNQVSDRLGNSMQFVYTAPDGSGSDRPDHIQRRKSLREFCQNSRIDRSNQVSCRNEGG